MYVEGLETDLDPLTPCLFVFDLSGFWNLTSTVIPSGNLDHQRVVLTSDASEAEQEPQRRQKSDHVSPEGDAIILFWSNLYLFFFLFNVSHR